MGSGNVAEVEQTLRIFYDGNSSDEHRKQAHWWLMELQDSKSAWETALNLLNQSNELTAQLFAVNCLNAKLLKNWEDCSDSQSVDTLKRFLWSHVFEKNYPVLVRDRLAGCLSILILQTVPDIWDAAVPDVIRESSKSNGHLMMTLQILAAIPYNFRRISCVPERKSNLRSELGKSVPGIQSFLSLQFGAIFQQQPVDSLLAESAISCLENWVEFESDLSDWDSLISFCLSPDLVAANDDVFGPVSRLFQDIASNVVLHQYEKLSLRIYQFIAAILRAKLDPAVESEDLEICATLAKMLSTLIENQAKFLLQSVDTHPDLFGTILTSLVKLTLPPAQYPIDEQYSSLMLKSWTAIYEDLTTCTVFTRVVASGDGNLQNGSMDECSRLKNILRPFYFQILQSALQYKLRLVDNFCSWPAQDKENFDMYRKEFSDVLTVSHRICGDDYVTALLPFMHIGEVVGVSTAAEDQEVAFYALESVAENCHTAPVLLPIFSALPDLAIPNESVANAVLRVVNNFASFVLDNAWFAYVLPVIIKSLDHPETVTEATLTLKDLAEPKEPAFYEACVQVLAPETPMYLFNKLYSAMNNRALQQGDRVRALTCIGHLISFLPEEEAGQMLNELVTPKVNRLQSIADGQPGAYASKEALLEELDFVATLVGSLDPRDPHKMAGHPVHTIMSRCLPIFGKLFEASGHNDEVAEKICEILQKSITSLASVKTVDLCAPYATLLTQLYAGDGRGLPQSQAVLPVVQKLFLVYGALPDVRPTLAAALTEISNRTVMFEATMNVDLYESYLSLMQNACRKQATFFSCLDSSNLVPIVKICIGGFNFAESAVLKQASFCFVEMLKVASVPAPHSELSRFVHDLLREHGTPLSRQIFDRLKDEPLVSCVEYLADVLFHMVKFFPDCIPLFLAGVPQHHLVHAMMRETVNKRKFREFAKKINVAVRKQQLEF